MLSLPAVRYCTTCFLLSIVALQWGCATTATMNAMKPAEINLHGVRRIAVLDVRGPGELAELATGTIGSRLQGEGGFAVVTSQELARFAPAPLHYENGGVNQTVALQAAARAGLDGLLIGQLARREEDMFGLSRGNIQIGDVTVIVSIEFQLIDVGTGKVIAAGRPEESYTGELDLYGSGGQSEEEVLGHLVEACSHQVAAKIGPHRVPIQIELAGTAIGRGATALWAGNSLARKGDWQAATQHWREALDENPENHAAAYNLGLAHESMDDYTGAARMFTLAASLTDKELYAEALARVDDNGRQYQTAMEQVASRSHQPAAPQHAWGRGPMGSGRQAATVSYRPPTNGQMRRLPPPE